MRYGGSLICDGWQPSTPHHRKIDDFFLRGYRAVVAGSEMTRPLRVVRLAANKTSRDMCGNLLDFGCHEVLP